MITMCEPDLGPEEQEMVAWAVRNAEISGNSRVVESFEEMFAAYIGVRHAVAVSSGYAALFLSSYLLIRGKSVMIPDITMIATANAALHAGAKIILCDVDPHGLMAGEYENKMPVHLWGQVADCESNGGMVIEDAAEAVGARVGNRKVGSLGDVGCFSFYANKILTTGEGGMITTDNDGLAGELRLLRSHYFGLDDKYLHPKTGFNFRMGGLAAALGIAQLKRIDELVARRQRIADRYTNNLAGYVGISHNAPGRVHWMYVIHTNFRDELLDFLKQAKIETRKYFTPLHRQPQFASSAYFPRADSLAQTGLLLPMNEEKCDFISDKVIEFLETKT